MFESTDSAKKFGIEDIRLEGSDGGGADFIQVITPAATLGASYYWLTVESGWVSKDGWYEDDFSTLLCEENGNKVEFKAGEGFYITVNGDNVKLVLPPDATK